MPTPTEIREQITLNLVQSLENDALPVWRQPWQADPHAGFPCNAASRRPYSGVNPLVLQAAATRQGYMSRYWATYRQWEALGGRVRSRPAHVPAGRWGTAVCFCKPVRTAADAGGEDDTADAVLVLRQFHVFNLDQVDGPFDHLRAGQATLPSAEVQQRCERAEAVIAATGADVRYGADRAAYYAAGDYILLPSRSQFHQPEYYETVFHELCHWAEHQARLNWDRRRPENTYAMGELIAELGGCYLAGELGLPVAATLVNHAAYLRHWLAAMRGDNRYIFRAAAQATRVVDYLLAFGGPTVSPDPAPSPALATSSAPR